MLVILLQVENMLGESIGKSAPGKDGRNKSILSMSVSIGALKAKEGENR
jgi:hypothetical protein